jgi:hypothetical protein
LGTTPQPTEAVQYLLWVDSPIGAKSQLVVYTLLLLEPMAVLGLGVETTLGNWETTTSPQPAEAVQYLLWVDLVIGVRYLLEVCTLRL